MSIFVSGDKLPSTHGQSIPQPLSTHEINQRISSIDASHIELIGIKMIEPLIHNLGPVGKARVALEVMKIKEVPEGPMSVDMCITMMCAKIEIEKGRGRFFSDEKASEFMREALWPVKQKIAESFSESDFFKTALELQISDYNPMGFVVGAAGRIRVLLTVNDVPIKYYLILKLDEQLTQEKSDLVFSLTEKSEGVEFSKQTFTVRELEEQFVSNFNNSHI